MADSWKDASISRKDGAMDRSGAIQPTYGILRSDFLSFDRPTKNVPANRRMLTAAVEAGGKISEMRIHVYAAAADDRSVAHSRGMEGG